MGTERYAVIETLSPTSGKWNFLSLWDFGKNYELWIECSNLRPATTAYTEWPTDVCSLTVQYTEDYFYKFVLSPSELPIGFGQFGETYEALCLVTEYLGPSCRILFCKDQ